MCCLWAIFLVAPLRKPRLRPSKRPWMQKKLGRLPRRCTRVVPAAPSQVGTRHRFMAGWLFPIMTPTRPPLVQSYPAQAVALNCRFTPVRLCGKQASRTQVARHFATFTVWVRVTKPTRSACCARPWYTSWELASFENSRMATRET